MTPLRKFYDEFAIQEKRCVLIFEGDLARRSIILAMSNLSSVIDFFDVEWDPLMT